MANVSRTFGIEDQRWFAAVSGDHNPLHVDAQWAASHFPGAMVVHGQHLLLWVLDQLASSRPNDYLASIEATFLKPVVIGDRVEASLADGATVIRVMVRQEIVMVARIRFGENRGRADLRFQGGPPVSSPRVRSSAEFAGLTGSITLPAPAIELLERFPSLVAIAGADRVIGLAAVSTLVGMDCPGLRGMLSRVSVDIAEAADNGNFAFEVRKFHESMNLVEMEFSGLGIAGTVTAFAGPDPIAPVSDDAIRAMVSAGEFRNQQPLIIGASSGLGAATARLLAAGGADPVLTWHDSKVGETVTAIQALGATGRCVRLDATAPSQGLAHLAEAGWNGGEMYYFATPRIFRRRLEPYQKQDLRDFTSVFVDGFYELVRELASMRSGPLTIFYPSSVVVEEPSPDLLEYAWAKTIGEQVCAQLQKKVAGLKIVVARLPRIATRQTETFLKVKSSTPEATMLPFIRAVQSTAAA